MDLSKIVHDFKPNKRTFENNTNDKSIEKKVKVNTKVTNKYVLKINTNGEKVALIHNITILYERIKKSYLSMKPDEIFNDITIFIDWDYDDDICYAEWNTPFVSHLKLANIIIKMQLNKYVDEYKYKCYIIQTQYQKYKNKDIYKYLQQFKIYVQKHLNLKYLPYVNVWKFNIRNCKNRNNNSWNYCGDDVLKNYNLWLEFYTSDQTIVQDKIYEMFNEFYEI